MKLGAQFYSIRDMTKTPAGVRESFLRMRQIGYGFVQLSGICYVEPEMLREFSDETGLAITCTHSPFERIINDTDALIGEHIIYRCPVIGIGSMPPQYRESIDGAQAFIRAVREPIKKIRNAGLSFAYHNHAFEFASLEGGIIMDYLLDDAPELDFILDTYWVKYGGYDPIEYIRRIGKDRMSNIHLKDMKNEPNGAICPCGEGVMDFASMVAVCNELNIPYALVEQDNAPETGDSYGQMALSFANLKHLF